MKKTLIDIVGISLIWLSCPQESSPTPEPFNGESARITQVFDSNQYSGPGIFLTTTNTTSTNARIFFTSPSKKSLQADAYIDISGTIQTDADNANGILEENEIPYFLMRLTKDAEVSWYWIQGANGSTINFSQRVWLRFGPGEYQISVHRLAGITVNTEGLAVSWSWYTQPIAEIIATNLNAENGRFLYPSAIIQSDDPSILMKASAFSEASAFDYARTIHDFVVRDLFYDMDSIDFDRKPQDALYVSSQGLAVCEGYATYYAALLRARNIPVKYVTGLGNGGSHAWNRVSDGTQWKYVDTTWDDPLMMINGATVYHSDYPAGDNLRVYYFWKNGWPDHIVEEETSSRSISISGLYPGYPDGSY